MGHVQEVTDAKTLLDCQLACLRSETEYGFICRSAMWYPTDEDQVVFWNFLHYINQKLIFHANLIRFYLIIISLNFNILELFVELRKQDNAARRICT